MPSTRIESPSRGDSYAYQSELLKGFSTNSSSTTSQISETECKTWFEIKDKLVIKATSRGQDCVMLIKPYACKFNYQGWNEKVAQVIPYDYVTCSRYQKHNLEYLYDMDGVITDKKAKISEMNAELKDMGIKYL